MSMADLLIRHRPIVEKHIKLYTNNQDDVEDIFQEVYLHIAGVSSLDIRYPVAYLKQVAAHAVSKFYGKSVREGDLDTVDEQQPDVLFSQLYSGQVERCLDPLDKITYEEKINTAKTKLEGMALGSNKEAAYLLLVEGLSYREVSEATGKSEAALWKLHQRIKEKAGVKGGH